MTRLVTQGIDGFGRTLGLSAVNQLSQQREAKIS